MKPIPYDQLKEGKYRIEPKDNPNIHLKAGIYDVNLRKFGMFGVRGEHQRGDGKIVESGGYWIIEHYNFYPAEDDIPITEMQDGDEGIVTDGEHCKDLIGETVRRHGNRLVYPSGRATGWSPWTYLQKYTNTDRVRITKRAEKKEKPYTVTPEEYIRQMYTPANPYPFSKTHTESGSTYYKPELKITEKPQPQQKEKPKMKKLTFALLFLCAGHTIVQLFCFVCPLLMKIGLISESWGWILVHKETIFVGGFLVIGLGMVFNICLTFYKVSKRLYRWLRK